MDIHPKVGKPTLEVVLTTVGAGAKFDKSTYKTSAGLHGIGAKAVTALSEWTEAEVRRDGKVYHAGIRARQGHHRGQGHRRRPGNRTGTKITFKPDPEIFHDATFDYDTLETASASWPSSTRAWPSS